MSTSSSAIGLAACCKARQEIHMAIEVTINGQRRNVTAAPDTPCSTCSRTSSSSRGRDSVVGLRSAVLARCSSME